VTQGESEPFSLLYPVIDYFNHRFGEKVSWNMDKGDFSLVLESDVDAGTQIFNNYAPKGNEECMYPMKSMIYLFLTHQVLMGYGFCVVDNPCDQLLLRLARPPAEIYAALKARIPNQFRSDAWIAEESGFYIRGSKHYTGGYDNNFGLSCLRGMPPELVMVIQTFVSFSFGSDASDDNSQLELWYATLDALLHRLQQKRDAITQWDSSLPVSPQNKRQHFSKIYRDGQLSILNEVIAELEEFLAPLENGEKSLEETFKDLNPPRLGHPAITTFIIH
jgi:hypothetical protein